MSIPLAPVVNAVLDYADALAADYIATQQAWAVGWTLAGIEAAKAVAIRWIPTRGLAASVEHGSLVDQVNQLADNVKADVPNGYANLAKAPLAFAPVLYLAVTLATRYAKKGT